MYGVEVGQMFSLERKEEAYQPAKECSEFVNHLFAVAASKLTNSVSVTEEAACGTTDTMHYKITLEVTETDAKSEEITFGRACRNIALLSKTLQKEPILIDDLRTIVWRYIKFFQRDLR